MTSKNDTSATAPRASSCYPKIDLPTKRRRKHPGRSRTERPRRDNRKSRFDANFTGEDERRNAALEEYYSRQRIVPENEFSRLMQVLATPLPSSFRVVAHGAFRDSIQDKLRGQMSQLFQSVANTSDTQNSNEPLKPLSQIPWYPKGLAWSVSAPRQMLRRDNLLSPFHKFLVSMNEIGAINRQEAVSMIPPLLLDVHDGQSVIDMCAAPGSKTAQILELVSAHSKPLWAPGVVIANDADIKRCWMLTHQLKRFGSAELIITNHDAQHFPMIMSFDRVLCDVPCSGDGTLRKAPDIWRRWNSHMGIALHRLQRQIVERGVDLLRPGGRLVYSTCSMNPVENEAVVAHVLRKYGDDVELVDCSSQLPQLVRRAGLMTWYVKDNSEKEAPPTENTDSLIHGEPDLDDKAQLSSDATVAQNSNVPSQDSANLLKGWFRTFEDVPHRRQNKIVRSLFPPSKEEVDSGKFPLHRCLRLVPHDQDTGAFFVAVIHKKPTARVTRRQRRENQNGLDAMVASRDPQALSQGEAANGVDANIELPTSSCERTDGTGKALRASRLITDDMLEAVNVVSPETLTGIMDFFGLERHVGENYLMTRGADGKTFKRVVGLSRTARTVVRHAMGSRDKSVPPERQVARVVSAGVRVLERTDRKDTCCTFRLVHEGVGIMREMMKARVMVGANVDEVVKLLKSKTVKMTDDVVSKAVDNCNFWERLFEMGSGSAVVVCDNENIVVWIGKRSVSVVMPDEIVQAMVMRITGSADVNCAPTIASKVETVAQ